VSFAWRARQQATARKLKQLSLQSPSSASASCYGVSGTGSKTSAAAVSGSSTGAGGGRTQDLVRSSSTAASNDRPGVVRIEIRDRDVPKPAARDQLLKPLAQTQSVSCGTASKQQKPTKT